MSSTTVVFADTNIVVYAYGVDPFKVAKAKCRPASADFSKLQLADASASRLDLSR
jgi:hypothetical protein